jgi:hypothetical protein
MQTVHKIAFIVCTAALILACGMGGAVATPGHEVATAVASTMGALTSPAPAATATSPAPQGIPVSYKQVSFILPSGLATDAPPETVAVTTEQNGAPWDVAPEHIHFRFSGYNVPAGSFSVNQIDIYPAKDYANANQGANIGLQRLRGLLLDPSAALTNEVLPQVPYFNAASMFAAQAKRIHFQNGDGVRMLTQYGQAVGPVTNNSLFYHFEGLTGDGNYYIVAVLPVNAPFLQSGNDPSAPVPAGGVPFPAITNSMDPKLFEDYFNAVTDKLNSADPAAFQPSLTALDALVQSINVQP